MIQLKVRRTNSYSGTWEAKGNDISNITGNGKDIQEALEEYRKLFKTLTKMELIDYKWR